jgi:hypothetical protein
MWEKNEASDMQFKKNIIIYEIVNIHKNCINSQLPVENVGIW